jgi:DNA repair exonuclease SbcCD ATPase subunit
MTEYLSHHPHEGPTCSFCGAVLDGDNCLSCGGSEPVKQESMSAEKQASFAAAHKYLKASTDDYVHITLTQLDHFGGRDSLAALMVNFAAQENAQLGDRCGVLEESVKAMAESHEVWTKRAQRAQLKLEKAEAEIARLKEALEAAVPFLFEYGGHYDDRCFTYPDMCCYCGLDAAKQMMEAALQG